MHIVAESQFSATFVSKRYEYAYARGSACN